MQIGSKKFAALRDVFRTQHAARMMTAVSLDSQPTDAELVAAARGGDVVGFGALLERHRPDMRAVAISLLGWGPDADDVVQDAILVALSRLDDLRDPSAAGPWLRAITRNAARMLLRSAGRKTAFGPLDDLPAPDPSPEKVLDDHALRDWVWAALEELTEPLQVTVLLRYFTAATSYEQIAAACEIPVGTVRSRLSQARRKLDHALRATAATAHYDTVALTTRRRHEAEDLLSSAAQGQFRAMLAAATVPNLQVVGPQGQRARGPDTLADIMDSDTQAGVRQRLNQITAGNRITILECDLLSPPWDPHHCPPAALWLMALHDHRIEKIRLFHPTSRAKPVPDPTPRSPGAD